MTRHVFKLVWNRKRSTGLIFLEILICFLVLCSVLASGIQYLSKWRSPRGFESENVWVTNIGGADFFRADDEETAAIRLSMAELLRNVRRLPDVEEVGISFNVPYSNSAWMNSTRIDGRSVPVSATQLTPETKNVLGIELLTGRWIEDTDAALAYTPAVISRNLARDLFGMDSPLGQNMPQFDDDGQLEEPGEDDEIFRVVGVTADYRHRGELNDTPYVTFSAVDLVNGDDLPREMLIRVRPGTTAAFEETLVRTMQRVVPGWSYDTQLLDRSRRGHIMQMIGPLLIAAVIAGFLIVMVGLGLVGVLWQSVTRRTGELGLRRALGASEAAVRRQILGELWALTTCAVALGAVIFLQLPLFGANFGASWSVFAGGLTLATLVIYGFVTFCGLYPTWLATRVQPATALQYE